MSEDGSGPLLTLDCPDNELSAIGDLQKKLLAAGESGTCKYVILI